MAGRERDETSDSNWSVRMSKAYPIVPRYWDGHRPFDLIGRHGFVLRDQIARLVEHFELDVQADRRLTETEA